MHIIFTHIDANQTLTPQLDISNFACMLYEMKSLNFIKIY